MTSGVMSGNGASLFGGTLDAGAAVGGMTGGEALAFGGMPEGFGGVPDADKSAFDAIFGGGVLA